MPTLEHARAAAEFFRDAIAHLCSQVEIAGSIRRGKGDVKDIEIVAIGRREVRPVPGSLFESAEVDVFNHWLDAVVAAGKHHAIVKPLKRGDTKSPWGEKYKRLWVTHDERTFAVDLFQVTAETWGAQFAIRTGPAEFTRRVVMKERDGGAMPGGMQQADGRLQVIDQTHWRGDEWKSLDTPTEAAWFAAIGLPCWPPHERTEARLIAWLKENGRVAAPAHARRQPTGYTPFRKDARCSS